MDKQRPSPADSNLIFLPENRNNKPGYISVYENPQNGKRIVSTFIVEPIMDVEDYYNLIHALTTAREQDEIVIKLASPGGSIETGIFICNAIFNCKGTVRTEAMGICASIAAVIWCCGKIKSMTPAAILMFHMPSGFSFGKTADIEEQAGFFQKYFKDLLPLIARDILTKEEFKDMIENRRDIFITYGQLKSRLANKGV